MSQITERQRQWLRPSKIEGYYLDIDLGFTSEKDRDCQLYWAVIEGAVRAKHEGEILKGKALYQLRTKQLTMPDGKRICGDRLLKSLDSFCLSHWTFSLHFDNNGASFLRKQPISQYILLGDRFVFLSYASPSLPAEAAKAAKASGRGRRHMKTIRKYWLLKSEPAVWPWREQAAAGRKGACWDGVRNHAAKKNLQAMRVGDRGFFYHSNEGKEIVGIVEIIREAYPDPTAGAGEPWVAVDVAAVEPLPKSVSLAGVKAEPRLSGMALVAFMRLSVQSVTAAEWALIRRMGGMASDV